ncbi:MAG TPA: hypothetical protein VGM93_12740 [Acidimicrobiales bacterium]
MSGAVSAVSISTGLGAVGILAFAGVAPVLLGVALALLLVAGFLIMRVAAHATALG